jgi:hypothetical protein
VERGRNCGMHGMGEMVRSYRCAYRGSGGVTPVILNIGIKWRYVDGFPSGRCSSGESAPGTNRIKGSVGPTVSLDVSEMRKKCCPYRESNNYSSIFQSAS